MNIPRYWVEPENCGPFETIVEEVRGNKIRLKDQILYPEGGGQPSDKGVIISGNQRLQVEEVQKENGVDWVILDRSNDLVPGKKVIVQADALRRQILMQMHSGQHLFSAILEKNFGLKTMRAQMGVNESEIDTDVKIDEDVLNQAETLVNQAIFKNYPITSQFFERMELSTENLRGGMEGETEKDVHRVVVIGNNGEIDRNLCGGTHLKSTGEIGLFLITSIEGKRVKFKCGKPAMDYAENLSRLARKLKIFLSSNVDNIVDKVEQLQDETRRLRKNQEKMGEQLLNTSIRIDTEKPILLDLRLVPREVFQKWKPSQIPELPNLFRLKDNFLGITGPDHEISKLTDRLKALNFRGNGKNGKYLYKFLGNETEEVFKQLLE